MKNIVGVLAVLGAMSLAQPATSAEQAGHKHERGQQESSMGNMHQHMQSMKQKMKQIHATQDKQTRRRLMDEHMASMREGMMMMGKMDRSMKQSADKSGMSDRRCTKDTQDCKTMNAMAGRQEGMEQRMGMMQMMMEQMMEHEAAEQNPSN